MLLARKEIFGGILFDSIKKQFSVLNILAFEQIIELLNSNKVAEIPLLLQQLGLTIPANSTFKFLPELVPVKGALSSPSVVFFVVTNKCNLRCKHCFVSNSVLSSPNSDLPLQDIQKIILDLKKNNVFKVIITGGEPFLRKDIIDILSFVSKQGLANKMTGTLS